MKKRRLLGVLLCLVMVLSILPGMTLTASADDITVTPGNSETNGNGTSFTEDDNLIEGNETDGDVNSLNANGESDVLSLTVGESETPEAPVQLEKAAAPVAAANVTNGESNALTLTDGESETPAAPVQSEDATATVNVTGVTIEEESNALTLTVDETETLAAPVQTENAAASEDDADVTIEEESNTLTLTVGETKTLTAVVQPEDATDKTVIWSSSDENAVTVADGVVTAVVAGKATITATATNGTDDDPNDDVSATYEVAVEEATDNTDENSPSNEPEDASADKKVALTATRNATDPVSYIDWDDSQNKLVEKTCTNYTVVVDSTEDVTYWGRADEESWWVVNSNVTINHKVVVNGDVHLILCDGASLEVKTSTTEQNFAIGLIAGSKLTIYGQSTGTDMGSLTAEGYYGIGSGSVGCYLTINGGNVTANGGQSGIVIDQAITIHGGNILACGDNYAIFHSVINYIQGIGWENKDGTGEGKTIERSSGEQHRVVSYKKVVFTAPVDVYVSDVTIKESTTLIVGDTEKLVAAVQPENATDKTVKWSVTSVSGTDAVKLYSDADCTTEIGEDATDILTVYAKGESVGTATVTVTSNADSTKYATCDVTVNKLPDVSYMDWNDSQKKLEEKTCSEYTVVTKDTTVWSEGWYVVKGNVTISGSVATRGNVNLILCDGATLTVSSSNNSAINVGGEGGLTIYGQSAESGKLTAIGTNGISANGGNITIDSGSVIAEGNGNGDKTGYGIFADGNDDQVIINSGNVTAEGSVHGIYAEGNNSSVTINKAVVTAVGTEHDGISAVGNVIITGGDVTARGGAVGIDAGGNITITNSSTVKAEGDLSGITALANNSVIEISSSVVTATGGEFAAVLGKVKNTDPGTGWTNTKGTEGQTSIVSSTEGQTLEFKKVMFPTAGAYYVYSGNNQTWQKGSSSKLTITFKCESNDDDTYEKWNQKVLIDDKEIGSGSFKGREGSLVIDLEPAYLETLSVGKHTMYVSFSDGAAEAVFNITETDKDSASGDTKKKTDNVVTCQMAGYPANYEWNEAAKACQPGYLDANGVFHPYRSPIPNTYDVGVLKYFWAFMASIAAAFICSIVLVADDHKEN